MHNVHHKYIQSENEYFKRTIDSANHRYLQKLSEFAAMAEQMSYPGKIREKSLTKDTSMAISQTCKGLIELCDHLLNEKSFEYVMLKKFSSDPIEKEFGKLRQGYGRTYFVTVMGVMEKVAINTAKLFLKFNDREDLSEFASVHECSKCSFVPSEDFWKILENIDCIEDILTKDSVMGLIYVAGYVTRKHCSAEEDSTFYFEKYGDFLRSINNGGLKVPGDMFCQWTIQSYIVFQKHANDVCRNSLVKLLMSLAERSSFFVTEQHARVLSNVLLKNYCALYTPRSGKEPKQKLLKLLDG